jgi:nucleotidyltransferase/DNA polymerase involved in DNA repair
MPIDLDAFFCAVEEQRDASLHGTAFAVGGRPEERGVVASCSYAARRFGGRSALPLARSAHPSAKKSMSWRLSTSGCSSASQ